MIDDMVDAIAELASDTYVATRRPVTAYAAGRKVEPQSAPDWAPDTLYTQGFAVGNAGNVYTATTGGLSAPSPATGPSGTGTATSDGACVWRWSAPRISTFSILASVQPLNGRELERLPEAMRAKELLTVFTTTELRTAVQGANEPDSIVIDNENYEVQAVQNWKALGNYFRATVAKVGR